MAPWGGSSPNQTFSRTNGFNSGDATWQSDDAQSVDIVSSRHDTHDQDLSDGVNSALKKDGGNTATANLPMGGFKHTNVADAVLRNQYASFGQIQDTTILYYPTVGGTVDAITLAGAAAPITAYATGQCFRFFASGANTSATPTVNVDGVGTKTIVRGDGSALVAGDIISGNHTVIAYNGSNFEVLAAYVPGGGDVAVADGGTGASTAANARTNLGVTATASDTTYNYRASNLSDVANAATAFGNIKQAASTSATGVIQAADQTAMEAKTSGRAVTADVQHFHPGMPKAAGRGLSSGGVVGTAYNVTSIVRNSTGSYTVTLSVTMSSTNYWVVATPNTNGSGERCIKMSIDSATTFTVLISNGSNSSRDEDFGFAVFGDI